MEITIEAQSDYLEKISRAKPLSALAELVWNALDGDATQVRIRFLGNEIGTDTIEIADDGHGFSHKTAISTFGALGGSWKREAVKSTSGRHLHGKEGHGRFRAFTLGNAIKWEVAYREDDTIWNFTIEGKSSNLSRFVISDPLPSRETVTGVKVLISDPIKQYKIFDEGIALTELASVYAPYLASYSTAKIWVGNTIIDIESRIRERRKIDIESTVKDLGGTEHSFELEIYEWSELGVRELYFCDENGFPLSKYEKQIRGIGDYSYTAYVRSSYFTVLKETGEIEVSELTGELEPVIAEALKKLKSNFLDRYREDQKSILDRWKEENVYPFEPNTNRSAVEEAEEKVFDILALNMNEVMDEFDGGSLRQKRLQLKLLQQAIESNPGNIRRIIEEVLNLPKDKADELASLLEYTSLSAVISTAKIITDRLKFIGGFEEIVFDVDLKQRVKERSQLHRILADNTWFFGDEFSLSVDDQSLTEVLVKYSAKLQTQIVIDKPVLRTDGRVGIIDLMLSKAVPSNRADEAEFLVIELKAPKVKIGQDEINQIQSYAFAVAADERFRGLKARWEFWVVSNDMDDIAMRLANQRNYPRGTIYQNADAGQNDVTIKIRTWSELLAENKHRHLFVKNQLNLSITNTDGLGFLQQKYEKYLGRSVDTN